MKEAKGLIKKHDFVDDRTRDAVCLDMAVFMQDSVHPTLQAVERFVYPGTKRAWPLGKHEDPILQRWTCHVTQNGAQSLKTQHTLKRFWAFCITHPVAGYPPSSSSNTFASWRSAVSKPSVNQR